MTTNEIINKYGERAYGKLKHKHNRSVFWFLFLNIFSISLISILIILNLFAIRWNTTEAYKGTVVWFVIMAGLNGFIGVITSVVAFLKLRVNLSRIDHSLREIDKLKKAYVAQTGQFEKPTYRDEKYIQLILDAIKQAEA